MGAVGCTSPEPHFACEDGGCEVVCKMSGDVCASMADCCPGLACNGGTCGCALIGNACGAATCCSGLSCTSGSCCGEPGATCSADGQCCQGFSCANGVCACHAEGDSCSPGGEPCCSGTSCDPTGHCRAPCSQPVGACQPLGADCTTSADCCDAGSCNGGKCGDPATALNCATDGQPCVTSATCCGSLTAGSKLDCVAGPDGGNVCHLGLIGESCDALHHCIPGTTCVFPPPPDAGSDAGLDDGGLDGGTDDGGIDDGGLDSGIDDGGLDSGIDDGGLDAGPADGGAPVDGGPLGICTLPSTTHTCDLYQASCGAGDPCDPNSNTNQGYDPCYLKVSGNNLAYRTTYLFCHGSTCTDPVEGEPCTSRCIQTAGDSRTTACVDFYDGSKLCMPACSREADCRGASIYDPAVYTAQPLTNYCVNYGAAGGCQPELCFVEGSTMPDGDPSLLYKPCAGHPDSLCLPRYDGRVSQVVGFCTVVRPDAGSTVGQACDSYAGVEASAALCGPDATCLGGRCAGLCDASQLGGNGTPACSDGLSCQSPQGLDLVADYQFGGCGDGCDPFADLTHSGCADYCGGPKVRCNWIIGDPVAGVSPGYCGAALETPIADGQPCSFTSTGIDPCVTGDYCLYSSATGSRFCTRLCNPTADAGSPDLCPGGQTCTAFTGFNHSGYCN